MKKIWCVICLFVAGILWFHADVMAADVTVGFEADALMEDTTNWDVKCTIDGQSKITNGKIRIKYDGKKLKLLSSEVGSLLSGMISNINDPINGNREEGEVLLVFAALSATDAKGELLKLRFEPVSGQIKNGEKISISAVTEEMAYDDDNISVSDSVMEATVGDPAGVTQKPSMTDTKDEQTDDDGNTGGAAEGDTEASSEPTTETTKETEVQNSNNGGSSGNGNSGSSSGTSGTQNGTSTSGTQSSGNETVTSAKTGDETNFLKPLILAILALIVLAGGFVWSKKKK